MVLLRFKSGCESSTFESPTGENGIVVFQGHDLANMGDCR
jgi:hypothetical protein